LRRIGREYGVRIIPESERPGFGANSASLHRAVWKSWRHGCGINWARAPKCARFRGADCCSSACRRPTQATGSASRCCRRPPTTVRRARRCGAPLSPARFSSPRFCSPAIWRDRCATCAMPSSASAAARRRRRCPSTDLPRS
jgi:hypothetical protein